MAIKKRTSGFKGKRNTNTKAANEARSKKAEAFAKEIGRILYGYRTRGYTARKMAEALNADGKATVRGKPWSERQVRRLFARLRTLKPSSFKN